MHNYYPFQKISKNHTSPKLKNQIKACTHLANEELPLPLTQHKNNLNTKTNKTQTTKHKTIRGRELPEEVDSIGH